MVTAPRSLVCAVLPCLAMFASPVAIASDSAAFEQVVKPFLTTHCTTCHGEKKQKGDLRLDTLATDLSSPGTAGHWMEVMERINSGDMPPKKEARPPAGDIAKVADWITGQLIEADRARQRGDQGKVTYSRLTREEYRNSIRDLLGITVDVFDPTGLPEDPAWHGFERIGSVLTLSPAHIEKYLAVSDLALSEALALEAKPPELLRETYDADGLRRLDHRLRDSLAAQGVLDQVRVDVVPNNTVIGHPGEGNDVVVKVAGEYRFRVTLSALRPEGGRAPRLLVYAASISRVLYEGDVEAPIDQPTTIAFSAHLPVGRHQIRLINAVPGPRPEDRRSRPINSSPFFTLKRRLPWQMKLTDEVGKPLWPLMVVDRWNLEGPVQASWPPPAHQQLFTRGPDAAKDAAYARDIINRFATRAWRRPVEATEIDRLVRLAEKDQSLGNSFEASVKTALQAVLCSPRFLFLAEGSAGQVRQQLDAWELASRLSYFLWSTLPDEQLTRLAASGQLLDQSVLRGEVRRMLSDAKAAAFAESFPRQWLHLRQVGMFAPDSKLYPDYDDHLQSSMIAESIGYFREVLTNNLSVREFLASDWTMLNERLALHYGISGPGGEKITGDVMRRVTLKPEDHRGGLLTQGAILSMTSDGTRHRPVHRGVWMLEAIIGKPPPPPPANVPAISTGKKDAPKTSLRAKLEAHRADERCASCHAKIDPLGLAFDHYDAIGRWRTEEKVQEGSGDDPKIDASGELIDGRKFANHDELKQLLVADLPQFASALTDHLATYALRRGMSFADKQDLHAITAACAANGWRLGDLVEHLVVSDLFQRR